MSVKTCGECCLSRVILTCDDTVELYCVKHSFSVKPDEVCEEFMGNALEAIGQAIIDSGK